MTTNNVMSASEFTVSDERAPARFHLGRRARRAWLTAHIITAGAWIGIDLVLAVLVFTARLTDDRATKALCYQALALFAVWPLLTAGVGSLVTGVVLGLGTNYGLVKYRWVTIKLVINVVLVVLIALALRPAVAEAARYGRALAAGQPTDAVVDKLVMPPIVSSVALVAATILSVYKPWGRTRRSSDPARRGRSR